MGSHEIAWDRMRSHIMPFSGSIEFDSDLIRSHEIACDRMRSHEIACDRMQSHEIANLMSTTVRVLENASGTRSGTESLLKSVSSHNCEQISYR